MSKYTATVFSVFLALFQWSWQNVISRLNGYRLYCIIICFVCSFSNLCSVVHLKLNWDVIFKIEKYLFIYFCNLHWKFTRYMITVLLMIFMSKFCAKKKKLFVCSCGYVLFFIKWSQWKFCKIYLNCRYLCLEKKRCPTFFYMQGCNLSSPLLSLFKFWKHTVAQTCLWWI